MRNNFEFTVVTQRLQVVGYMVFDLTTNSERKREEQNDRLKVSEQRMVAVLVRAVSLSVSYCDRSHIEQLYLRRLQSLPGTQNTGRVSRR